MYLIPLSLFAAAAAVLSDRFLRKTQLSQWLRLLLSLLLGILLALTLFWAMIRLSIFAFQINDPITM